MGGATAMLLPFPSKDEVTKRCFKCGVVAPLSAYYRHPRMADGHLNKCKTCAKRDVRTNRAARRKQYAEYERERFQRPERREAVKRALSRHRKRHPDRARARSAVNNAVRSGRLTRGPCQYCGTTERVQAHHDDYARPLDVTWACFPCHREVEHGQKVIRRSDEAA